MKTGRPPSSDQSDFGKRLSLARKKKGLTQLAMAQKLGISQRVYSFWERSAASLPLKQIPAMAEILDITPNDLFGKGNKPKRSSSKRKPSKK